MAKSEIPDSAEPNSDYGILPVVGGKVLHIALGDPGADSSAIDISKFEEVKSFHPNNKFKTFHAQFQLSGAFNSNKF